MNYGPSYLPSSSSSSDDETFSHYVEQWEEDMKQCEEEDEILARLYVANNKIMAYFSKEKERSKRISLIPHHLVINHEREEGNSGIYDEYFSDNPTYGVETPPLSSLNRKPIKMKKSKRDIDEVETPPISALNPNPIKKKKSKRDIDEVETPPISPLNPKPIKNEDEDVSPLISNSKSKKKKHEKNCIEQSKDKSPEKKEEGNEPCYLPGQKHDRPNERDLLRIFFETLYQQLPDCELASKWMMEWGLLPEEEAMNVYERDFKRATSVSRRKTDKGSSTAIKKMKEKKVSNSSEDDFILSEKKKKMKQKQKQQQQKVSSS